MLDSRILKKLILTVFSFLFFLPFIFISWRLITSQVFSFLASLFVAVVEGPSFEVLSD